MMKSLRTKPQIAHFGDQNARRNLWASRASRSCHDVVVTTTECRSPRETPKNKEFGLTSTFQMVILLWMDCPDPCPALTGVVLFYGPPHPLFYAVPMRFAKHQLDCCSVDVCVILSSSGSLRMRLISQFSRASGARFSETDDSPETVVGRWILPAKLKALLGSSTILS